MLEVLLILCLCYLGVTNSIVSFTANGKWGPAIHSECDHFMCTPNNLTWVPSSSTPLNYYFKKEACDALVKKGVKKIFFHGDSYMRQIYAALLITLNGDYRYGSLANSTLSPQCEYHRQFYEKNCGTRQLNHYGIVCDGQVILDPLLNGFGNTNHCHNENGTLVLWSFANYKLGRHGRAGVNNATMYQEFFQREICPHMKSNQALYTGDVRNHPCSVWWISTHYRMRAYFDDEKTEVVKRYNEEMRWYFDSPDRPCGAVNYVDVYNMTAALGTGHPSEAEKMTYDGVHWGMEGNLIKAQIIINAILSAGGGDS